MIVISEKGKFSSHFMAIEVVLCIVCSFIYAWFSAFAKPEYYSSIYIFEALMEAFFFASMLKRFITDFTPEGHHMPNRSLGEITKNYLRNGFLFDLVPLLPITFISLQFHPYIRLFYLIKVCRIVKAARIPITQNVLNNVKELRKKSIIKQIEEDPTIGEDKNQDHNNIENLLMINYCLKTTKMIIVMTSFSYFVGIIWYIYCDLSRKIVDEN